MINEIKKAVENGKIKLIEEMVGQALADGIAAEDILSGMVDTMGVIGDRFQKNEVFVPEMLVAALTMKKGVAVLKPSLMDPQAVSLGKCIIGTVAGDMHDIGKNLVALMMESVGFEVVDLGVDVPADKFVEAVKANPDCRIVGLSSLLTTSMDAMRQTVEDVRAIGFDKVKIMVGGAPVTEEFARSIGADAYTPDAGSAAAKAKELVG